MLTKKEFQDTIVKDQLANNSVSDEEFFSILKILAPGTNLRAALDGALRAGKGALIVIENDVVQGVSDGGFRIGSRFTPQRLIELAKMDGAIILSKDIKRITQANVLLTPDNKIKTNETGTRHKAAERTAKQTGALVIAISERRHEITVYYKNKRYNLQSSEEILRKANENIQLLEKQRELFDSVLERLNKAETTIHSGLSQAINVIQRGHFIQKIALELNKYLIELGREGILLKTRMREMMTDVEKETDLVVKDYTKLDLKKSKQLLQSLSYEEILDKENILKVLAYEKPVQPHPEIKGWRILSKTSLAEQDAAIVIRESKSLRNIMDNQIDFYKNLIGEEKAIALKSELDRLKV